MNYKRLVCIGLDKCGTSWLYKSLITQNAIHDGGIKELGLYYKSEHLPVIDNQIIIDIEHNYFKSTEALNRIKNDANSLVVLMLRNPKDRAEAHFNEFLKRGDKLSDLYCDKNISEVLQHSDYQNIVNTCKDLFKDRLHIVFFDDIENDPEGTISKVCCKLGVSFVSNKDIFKRYNIRRSARNRYIGFIYKYLGQILRFAKLEKLLQFLRLNPFVVSLGYTKKIVELPRFPEELTVTLEKSSIFYKQLKDN